MRKSHLLIADDEPDIAAFVESVAIACGYETTGVSSAEALLQQLRRTDLTHIILDLKMPGLDGIEVLRHLSRMRSQARIVIFSGTDQKIREAARRLGAEMGLDMAGMLSKPVRLGELRSLLEALRPSGEPLSAAMVAAAIAAGELFLEYQPKQRLPSRELAGVEALVRWRHPSGRTIPPGDFLPVIESTDVMEDLTWFVAEAALDQIGAWSDNGLALPVAINLSSHNLSRLDFADRMAAACEERGVAPGQLTLELTETAAIRDQLSSIDILTRLRLKGFDLSIDDFGTGYSSIVQLYRLPFGELKIDRAFVRELGTSRDAEVIVKAMVDLAHNLSLRVCAEGVESEATLAMVTRLGCDLAQGFHIGRPMLGCVIPNWAGRTAEGSAGSVVNYPSPTGKRAG